MVIADYRDHFLTFIHSARLVMMLRVGHNCRLHLASDIIVPDGRGVEYNLLNEDFWDDDKRGGRKLLVAGVGLYQVLELEKGATPDQIRKSYKWLALMYHPDKNNDPSATAKFKEVYKAHQILADPSRKTIYDKHGSRGLRIAEKLGENVHYYSLLLSSWWYQTLFGISCILTGCHCCGCCLCCCNCCCGKCVPNSEEEDINFPDVADLAPDEEEEDNTNGPTVTQPLRSNNPFSEANRSPTKTASGSNASIIPLGLVGPPSATTSQLITIVESPGSPSKKTELNAGPEKNYSSTASN